MGRKTSFFTGFPGFIASKIIERLMVEEPGMQFILLVQASQLEKAEHQIQALCQKLFQPPDRFTLIAGDITKPNLGMEEDLLSRLRTDITHVFHLAAIYDLAVPREAAYRVNVEGTRNVNDWCLQLEHIERYIYFSTAYVSGKRTGRIFESELSCGQAFKNFYESTKYEAEALVQAVRSRLPVTIIRPAIVMGDSKTGETDKFDGPYFIMRFLDKFARLPIPYLGKGEGPFNLVPVDYIVEAACFLAMDPIGENKVYHLTDPEPYQAKEVYRLICEALTGKAPRYTVSPSAVASLLAVPAFRRWVMVEKETINYFLLETEYDCSQTLKDLQGTGITCPDFADYISMAVRFYKEHRQDHNKTIQIH
ncbi:SDR family oxidoreductase [Pseudobacillus badius]|uniref:SDR family oxidoreductase n=1 Tax=Bacillus badius TaxID=1455 RepID=UPI001CC03B90|nr:SDR family oxidoreductase [Bacillus badius]MED0666820.1 SDR family oxidoreductase [Bacillus badius]UAT30688.1 SDR family oxidoreductase [Bacillus badius]